MNLLQLVRQYGRPDEPPMTSPISCHPEVRRIYQLCMTDRKVRE